VRGLALNAHERGFHAVAFKAGAHAVGFGFGVKGAQAHAVYGAACLVACAYARAQALQ